MCDINFVREFGLMMEEARKEYLGCRERMLWIALFYVANDRAKYNPQTQTYEWPSGFFQISHQELNLYCDLNKKAILDLRNQLKQKGYIDFAKGERNAEKPMYKLNYLSLRDFGGENDPKSVPKEGPKMGAKEGPKMGAKEGPIIYKYKQGVNTGTDTREIDTQDYNDREGSYSRPREGGYVDLDGKDRPARYDSAWVTSTKARAAVAQRLIDGFAFADEPGSDLHSFICRLLEYGMPPELIEDTGEKCETPERLRFQLEATAQKQKYTAEAREWDRCMKIANGKEDFARRLYNMTMRAQMAQEA